MRRRRGSTVRIVSHFTMSIPKLTQLVRCPGLLLEKEPNNMQAQSLAELIDQKMTRGASASLSLSCPILLNVLCYNVYRRIHRPRTRRRRSSSRDAPPRNSHPASKPPLIFLFLSTRRLILLFRFAFFLHAPHAVFTFDFDVPLVDLRVDVFVFVFVRACALFGIRYSTNDDVGCWVSLFSFTTFCDNDHLQISHSTPPFFALSVLNPSNR